MKIRRGLPVAVLFAAACSYQSSLDLTCEPGQTQAGRVCEDGFWVNELDDLDGSVPDDVAVLPDQDTPPEDTGGQDVGCVPETNAQLCEAAGAQCGSITVTDRCGATITVACGTCTAPDVCESDNQCSCTPETPAQFCERLGKSCGPVTDIDNCGVSQQYHCGECEGGVDCGSQSPNVCGCPCNIDGICYPEGTKNPANPCEACVPETSATAWSVTAGAACSDGDACTVDDACSAAGVCEGAAKDCSCGAPGTTHCDSFDAGCATGTCDPANGNCVATTATNGTACTADALACTTDQCVNGSCTATIAATSCLIAGACYADGATNGPCEVCEPASDDRNWSVAIGAACNTDNLSCTSQSCNASGQCDASINAGTCLVDGVCYAAGDPSPLVECEVCDPATSQTTFSASDGGSCDDGRACTTGDVCLSGSCGFMSLASDTCLISGACYQSGDANPNGSLFCLSCDPATESRDWSVDAGTCFIGGDCIADGAADPGNPCQACDADTSQTSYTSAANGTNCGSGCDCQAGVCLKKSDGSACGG